MRVLVTGGAGFIGSHLVEKLVLKEHEVIVIDDLSNGHIDYLNPIIHNNNLTFIKGSILETELLESIVPNVDVVYHLASVLGVKNTVENPLKVIDGNINGTRKILQLANDHQVKVVFASTSEIYGKNTQLPFKEDSDRVLGPPQTHRWCYATAKALNEHICYAYAKQGLTVTVVRYFNTFGPRQTASQYGGVIPKFITAALTNQPITVYGDGSQTRSFLFVKDTVEATYRCMYLEGKSETMNIGSTETLSIMELAQKIKAFTQSNSEIVCIPYEKVYEDGFEETKNRLPDISKAKDIFGFSPVTSFDKGLLETIGWYKSRL
ncbi:NAD-dependent epimerase/dehydratase family protein [Metabacillus niabensis]|uniref:NAD-dependent epimerase/dehydratase family protein n=1 Tax=Metabacillus niabensis TaxID=324854 RepID=UPI0039A1868F